MRRPHKRKSFMEDMLQPKKYLPTKTTSIYYVGIILITIALIFTSCFSREDMFELANERPWEGPFELIDVYSSSNTSVRVVFSHYVDRPSGENIGNYSIPGLNIISAKIDASDKTSVNLMTFPQQQIQYELTVSGIVDVDGFILENEKTMNFQGDVAPSISSASSFDHTTVVVYFSEEVEQVSAETASNYSIVPGLGVVSAVRDGADWSKVTLVTDHAVWGGDLHTDGERGNGPDGQPGGQSQLEGLCGDGPCGHDAA